jgi:hypothetical protein
MGCTSTRRSGAPQEQRSGLEAGITSARCGKLGGFFFYLFNRLRVFRSAHTAHLGRGVGQERWLRVGPSEKYAAR